MLWEYRSERWPVLLTDILKSALNAAYLSTSVQDYLTLALEALGPSSTFSIERKTNVFQNVMNVLQVGNNKDRFLTQKKIIFNFTFFVSTLNRTSHRVPSQIYLKN